MSAIYNSPQGAQIVSSKQDIPTVGSESVEISLRTFSLKNLQVSILNASRNTENVPVQKTSAIKSSLGASLEPLKNTLLPKAKIMLTLFQIISGLPQVLNLPFPRVFNSLIDAMRYSSNFFTPKAGSLKCRTYHVTFLETLIVDTLLPIALSVLLLIAYHVHNRINIFRFIS